MIEKMLMGCVSGGAKLMPIAFQSGARINPIAMLYQVSVSENYLLYLQANFVVLSSSPVESDWGPEIKICQTTAQLIE